MRGWWVEDVADVMRFDMGYVEVGLEKGELWWGSYLGWCLC